MLETVFTIFILFALGAAIGSFLHVVAERYMDALTSPNPSFVRRGMRRVLSPLRRGSWRGLVLGRSYCPHCKKQLTARELVPIFSYIFQKGRCRGCGVRIPMHYAVLEVLSGILCVAFIAPAFVAGQLLTIPILLYIAACILIILIHIDARSMMLPDVFILILGIIALVIASISGLSGDSMAFGALVGAGVIYAIWLATAGQGIGFGDVKLMIPLGILFGFQGVVTLLFIAFLVGGLVGVVLLATNSATRKTAIPFGPFLAGAALVLMVFPSISDRFFVLLGV